MDKNPGDTQTLFGLKAAMAVFASRPHDIIRIYYRKDQGKALAGLLKWAASQRLVYREQGDEGLAKLAKSAHHEGVVLTVHPLRFRAFSLAEIADADRPGTRWLALDRVENPHNLGAILRSAAFFGVRGVLVGGVAPKSKLNSAALRVAEGGAEHLRLTASENLAESLAACAGAGWQVLGLETGSPHPLSRERATAPWILVAGHEAEGLSEPVRAACTQLITIPGSGRVGSLNVSVSVGVALAMLG